MNWRWITLGAAVLAWIGAFRDVARHDATHRVFAVIFAIPLGVGLTVFFIVLSLLSK